MTDVKSFSIESVVRPSIDAVPHYVPSKRSDSAPARLIKLDMNESPYGPSPKTREVIANFDSTNRYPDFTQATLRNAIATYAGADPGQIICGAGLDDVLNTLMQTIIDPGDEVIIHEPTFGVYRQLIGLHGGKTVDAHLTSEFQLDPARVLGAVTDRTKLILICNPNNPTGNQLDPSAIEAVVREAPVLVAIDEAYCEFAGSTLIGLMKHYENVLILRTMSKFAGLAGMRVGYGIFTPALTPYLQGAAPAFHNVSLLSRECAIASLDDLDYLRGVVARIVSDRDSLADQLREFPGVMPVESSTNFLLVKLPVDDSIPVIEELARRGIIVRHIGGPGLETYLRVTVGTQEENEIFLNELESILAENRR